MMHTRGERAIAVTALKAAVPYIRMFKRKVFVVKVGGAVFGDEDSTRELIEQLGKPIGGGGGRLALNGRTNPFEFTRTKSATIRLEGMGEASQGHEVTTGQGSPGLDTELRGLMHECFYQLREDQLDILAQSEVQAFDHAAIQRGPSREGSGGGRGRWQRRGGGQRRRRGGGHPPVLRTGQRG
jgi:hypothetical protein